MRVENPTRRIAGAFNRDNPLPPPHRVAAGHDWSSSARCTTGVSERGTACTLLTLPCQSEGVAYAWFSCGTQVEVDAVGNPVWKRFRTKSFT